MADGVQRIAVIGPESSGKSDLCKNLALHYNTKWVPEYAREYLTDLNRPYTFEDIIEIYKEQFRQEQEMLASASSYIFIDTEFIIAKVWCESVYKKSSAYLEEMILKEPYDFYLLTAPDLEWKYDPLRENPGKGDFFFDWYKKILMQKGLKYDIVSGEGIARTQNAISIIDSAFQNLNNI